MSHADSANVPNAGTRDLGVKIEMLHTAVMNCELGIDSGHAQRRICCPAGSLGVPSPNDIRTDTMRLPPIRRTKSHSNT